MGRSYYPFGLPMVTGSSTANPSRFGYQGDFAEEDQETGFNHFELREYDPVIGRWMRTDPARQFFSPYLAMGNNFINMVDVKGDTAEYWSPDGDYLFETWGSDARRVVVLDRLQFEDFMEVWNDISYLDSRDFISKHVGSGEFVNVLDYMALEQDGMFKEFNYNQDWLENYLRSFQLTEQFHFYLKGEYIPNWVRSVDHYEYESPYVKSKEAFLNYFNKRFDEVNEKEVPARQRQYYPERDY
ncbi:MAG: RHS repeat-associated core domain-containing protein [Marinoscillum sp.]